MSPPVITPLVMLMGSLAVWVVNLAVFPSVFLRSLVISVVWLARSCVSSSCSYHCSHVS